MYAKYTFNNILYVYNYFKYLMKKLIKKILKIIFKTLLFLIQQDNYYF